MKQRINLKYTLISVFVFIVMIFVFTLSVQAAEYSGTCGSNLTWALNTDNGILTISGTGPITNYTTTSAPWYKYRSSIKTVNISNGVTSIGNSTFYGCTALTSITIPDSVTSIGERSFSSCTGLTSVTIPDSVTSIGERAFSSCTGLASVTIPNSVTSIGLGAFYHCTGMTSVTIPDSVTSIGDYAFQQCTGLTSVTIPNSVTSIGTGTFYYCFGLTSINVSSLNEYYSSDENGVLFNKDKNVLIQYPVGNLRTDYTIPNSVTSIGSYAFYGCTGLTSITIPNSVTSIGSNTFRDCTGLTSITISNSVTSIGSYAFESCTGLTSVTIPNSVTSIGQGAFYECASLTSITIPNSVTSIGYYAFYGCTGLTSITIPNSVTSIGIGTFESCTGLKSITIPNSVTSIGVGAFESCTGLTSVTIPNSVTSIGGGAFYECTRLNNVTIPLSVTSIGFNTFRRCASLTSVTIPNSVTSIGDGAFSYCRSLTSVTIPDSVTNIGESAFSDCTGLTSVAIQNSVTSIGISAFRYCSGLISAFFYGNVPETFGTNVFANTAANFKIYYIEGKSGWTTPTWNGNGRVYNTSTFVPSNTIIADFNTSVISLTEGETYNFSGRVTTTASSLMNLQVNIVDAANPSIGIKYYRSENILNKTFDLSVIPSFTAGTTLTGYDDGNNYVELSLTAGKSYYIQLWANDTYGNTIGDSVKKPVTINERINKPTPTVTFDTSDLTLAIGETFNFTGNATQTDGNLLNFHVGIVKADDESIGIDYYRTENIGAPSFDFFSIPSFTAGDTLTGLKIQNNQGSLILDEGSYILRLWVSNEKNETSGEIRKKINIIKSVLPVIEMKSPDEKDITANEAILTAKILTKGKDSIKDYGFNLYGTDGIRYQQYSLTQTGIFKNVIYNNDTGEFSINIIYHTPGATYLAEAFVITSNDEVVLAEQVPFTMKTASVLITSPKKDNIFKTGLNTIVLSAAVTGTDYNDTEFIIYDYNMTETSYRFTTGGSAPNSVMTETSYNITANGSAPNTVWDASLVARGTYYIRAVTHLADGRDTWSAPVKFTLYIPLTAISIKASVINGQKQITMPMNSMRKLTVIYTPSYATSKYVTWKSDNESIVTVDKYGKVNSITPGTVNITCYAENGTLTDSVSIIVDLADESGNILGLDGDMNVFGDTQITGVNGPSVTFNGSTFPLFDLEFGFGFPKIRFKTNFDSDTGTYQIQVGNFKQNVYNNEEDQSYWKESYAGLKSLMSICGKKTSSEFYNAFRKYRKDFKDFAEKEKGFMGFPGYVTVFGYIELDLNGKPIEGGLVVVLETEKSWSGPLGTIPAAYWEFTIKGEAEGKVIFQLKETGVITSGINVLGSFKLKFIPTLGAGFGLNGIASVELNLEGKLVGTLNFPFKTLTESATLVIEDAVVYLKYQLFRFANGKNTWKFPYTLNIYPELEIVQSNILEETPIDVSDDMVLIPRVQQSLLLNKSTFTAVSITSEADNNIIKTNVYAYENAELAQLPDGRKLAIWVDDDVSRNTANGTALYYSICENGEWSIPVQINDDGTADFSPKVNVTADGIVHIIWQNATELFDESVTLDEMSAGIDISYISFNGTSFTTPVWLTQPGDMIESNLMLSGNANEITAAWTESISSEGGNDSVCTRTFNGVNWSDKTILASVNGGIFDISGGYIDGLFNIAIISDGDKNYATAEDILFNLINTNSNVVVSGNASVCSGLYILRNRLYFIESGQLYSFYSGITSDEQLTTDGIINNYSIIANESGDMAMIYTIPNGFRKDIYINKKSIDDTVWSEPVQITRHDKKVSDVSGIINDSGDITLLYILTEVLNLDDSDELYGTSDLISLTISDEIDLVLSDDIGYDSDLIGPSAVIPLTVNVTNNSVYDCSGYNVTVRDSSGALLGNKYVPDTLTAGSSAEILTEITLPADLSNLCFVINAIAVYGDDLYAEDNTKRVYPEIADLAVEGDIQYTSENTCDITALIKNTGYSEATGIILNLRKDSIDGNIIESRFIDNLEMNDQQTLIMQLDETNLDRENNTDILNFYIEIISDTREISYVNNTVRMALESEDDISNVFDIAFDFKGVAIKLIEPWGLRFYTLTSGSDFTSGLPFGTIVLHQDYYTSGMTAEEMMANPNAVILTSESGDSILDSSSRIIGTMVGGIYTYSMNTSFYTAAYVVINGEYIFSPVNSRNIYDRVAYLKDNSSDLYVKPIYQEMYNLYTDVKAYHDSLGTVTIPEPEIIKRGSECSPGTVASDSGLVSYSFKGVAIRLIEPWGLCFYTEMIVPDMNSVTEFGTVVLSEDDYIIGMTGEELRLSDNSYVFNSADGTAIYDSSNRIVAKLIDSIYTYNMDKKFYTVSYAIINGEYYYSDVNCRNMYDRVSLLKDTSTNIYVKEIYASMFSLYGAVDAYHRSLGLK